MRNFKILILVPMRKHKGIELIIIFNFMHLHFTYLIHILNINSNISDISI